MSLEDARQHLKSLAETVGWTDVGVLFDDPPSAVLTLLFDSGRVVAVLRFCLSIDDSVAAIVAAIKACTRSHSAQIGCCQGRVLTPEEITDLADLTAIWSSAEKQKSVSDKEKLAQFFEDMERGTKERGRADGILTETRNQVFLESHGRCMFDGCGEDLTVDPLTKIGGNFAYLAHNIASSEFGTRGVVFFSGELSNEPSNILLLCDVHHRLVDTVAKVDYPADQISAMRRRFVNTSAGLLDGLKRTPLPVYAVSWPIRGQVISQPSDMEIAQCLLPLDARMYGQLNEISDNNDLLREMNSDAAWDIMPQAVEFVAERLLLQTHGANYRAALFALGLMPALIALGAAIGNKSEITPMLRDRENNRWLWPADEAQGVFYDVEGLDELSNSEPEVILQISLTARPVAFDRTVAMLNHKVVSVTAFESLMGNSALRHPIDGYAFKHRMQELMHKLSDKHAVQRIHLLPCASNAACAFLGQAYDSYHPEMLIYDFVEQQQPMVARLRLHNVDNQLQIARPLPA